MDIKIEEELHTALSDLLLLHIAADKSVLTRHGLRRVRFYMLRHLYLNPGISLTQLGELSFTDRASTSRMIDVMEAEGLVQRQSKLGDRRSLALSLTDTGRSKYGEADTEFREDIQRRFGGVDSEHLSIILQNIKTLYEAMSLYLESQ